MLDEAMPLPKDPHDLRALARLLIAKVKAQAMLIEKLRHQLAGLRTHRFGTSSETAEQLQLALEASEVASAAIMGRLRLPEDDEAGEADRPRRRPLPDHIPRMTVEILPGEDACVQCSGSLRRLGEDVTEELECVPGVQHLSRTGGVRYLTIVNRIVRPRLACSGCERFVQALLPSRPIERGRPGPGLLAHVLVAKYGDHLPLYRQSQILDPLADAIGRHVLAGQAIFADDMPVQMLAPGTGRTDTARRWAYVREERPWAGPAPPAAWYGFFPDRRSEHPRRHLDGYAGWMLAEAYAGYGELYRSGGIREVACLAHVRRKFVEVHRSQGSAIAEEAIGRIARLYAIEKTARGLPPEERVRLRQAEARPVLDELETWLAAQLPSLSGKSPLAGAIRHALIRLPRLRPYLDQGILEIDNNSAERAMRATALGRKNYLFVGSTAGGKVAAIAYTLIETAKLNGVDPQAWIADTLARIPDHKITRIDEFLPWNQR